MKTNRRLFIATALLLVPLCLVGVANAQSSGETTIRWDIIEIAINGSTITILPGGQDRTKAADNSVLTLTGSGTFKPGESDEVTGGGTWKIVDSTGNVLGTGDYAVTSLIRFDEAPGTLPANFTDTIGQNQDARSGLAYLAISYSDGTAGVLVVSCDLPAGTPPSVLEGATASKQFTDFFNFVSGDTVFHVVSD